jgi:thiamine biosynthesis lipoprotein ApbE
MNRKRTKFTLALAGFLLLAVGRGGHPSAARAAWRVSQFENVLGTSLELKFAAASDKEASRAEAAALAEIERLDHILSGYERESEFNRWLKTSGRPTPVSPELFEVLSLFEQWRARSNGALDPAAQVVSTLWRSAAAERRTPRADELQAAVATIAQPQYRLDAAAQTATHLGDAPLILNSFAKSYIASRAADAAMRTARLDGLVVNIGGDLVARGPLAETVRIADPKADAENDEPLARILIRNRAVATSGNYRRGVEINGRWYSHIVDPRTALPVDHVISATVVAPQAADAGALATAFCVLTPEESLRLAASLPEVECLLITKNGERVESKGWRALEIPPAPRASLIAVSTAGATQASQTWDQSFELVVNFELARIEGQRYRRPYVAVWVEDKDHFPVRALALWYQKPKWLPDLKAWSRANRMRAMAEKTDLAGSVSSATRPAGKYTLKWDGKDDHGRLVKPGKYTVFIEAAREHGTYQLMRQEMDFNGAPKQFNLAGNVEIASALLDYRKKK